MVKIKIIPLLIIAFILVSCQQQQVVIPTLYELPTETSTATSTATPTATHTLIPTVTPSPTLTETLTRTPSNTPVPTASPTNTITPLPTATDTPTETVTPLPTRTPEELVISLYQSNNADAGYGQTVRLRWASNGETARIERQNNNGDIVETVDVAPTGSIDVTLPTTGTIAVYRLVVTRGAEEVRRSISFTLTAACTNEWFFIPTENIGCPVTARSSGQLTYQDFQRGYMIRLRSNDVNRVCGVQESSTIYTCFPIEVWDDDDDPPATPVPNRFEPGDAFKEAFYNQLAIGGFWYDQIGWARSPQVTSTETYQISDRGILYLQTPEGILGFDQLMNGGQAVIQVNSQ